MAIAFKTPFLILDDDKARKAAERLGLNYTGTFGIILRAKKAGLISSVAMILEKVQKTNFHYSKAVIRNILYLAGELSEKS